MWVVTREGEPLSVSGGGEFLLSSHGSAMIFYNMQEANKLMHNTVDISKNMDWNWGKPNDYELQAIDETVGDEEVFFWTVKTLGTYLQTINIRGRGSFLDKAQDRHATTFRTKEAAQEAIVETMKVANLLGVDWGLDIRFSIRKMVKI